MLGLFGMLPFGIIWTMWDIKYIGFVVRKPEDKYYLNHVGYKGLLIISMIIFWYSASIIWTMWDIKTDSNVFLRKEFLYGYYLNHVGYKVLLSMAAFLYKLRIIWTMWDIKCLIFYTPLNIGYVLSEPCGI